MSRIAELRQRPWARWLAPVVLVLAVAVFPIFRDPLDGWTSDLLLAIAFVVFGLGLNIVVGFAGLLDLGYVAFYAFGSLAAGWFASQHFDKVGGGKGIHVLVNAYEQGLPGIHLNFLLILIGAILVTAIAGVIIGLPTLRLRGDYIAIVTLAFGEIIYKVAGSGDQIGPAGYHFSNGRQSINPVDQIKLPFVDQFDSATNLRPYFWLALALVLVTLFVNFRLRDSRLGRAWIALREDEVAAVSMGVPLVRTKLAAYGIGAAFGGVAGAFIGSYYNSVNANQFQFGFSIFILAMVILGGLGSIWGTVLGSVMLSLVNTRLIPDVLDGDAVSSFMGKLGLNFSFQDVAFGVFGFVLVLVMVLRPEGLLPERRRKLELAESVGEGSVFEAKA